MNEFIKKVRKMHKHHFIGKRTQSSGVDVSKYLEYPAELVNVLYPDADTHKGVYQTVISCEMLQHNSKWKECLNRFYHNLEPGGMLLITCAGPKRQGIAIMDFRIVLGKRLFIVDGLHYERDGMDLCFYGIKRVRV